MRRVCLLTGAGGRLGAALCRLLAGTHQIAAVHRRRAPPEVEGLLALQADLAKPGEADRVVEAALQRFGRIDLLVNNAVDYSLLPLFDPRALAQAAQQLEVNVLAPLRLAEACARRFWRGREDENRRRRRSVVNVSSTSGLNVFANQKQGLYSASKSALNMLTRHLAAELEPLGVRANAAVPDSFPRRVATEEVAAGILELDEGEMTGELVVIERLA